MALVAVVALTVTLMAQQAAAHCQCASERTGTPESAKAAPGKTPEQVYLEATAARFKGINRCC